EIYPLTTDGSSTPFTVRISWFHTPCPTNKTWKTINNKKPPSTRFCPNAAVPSSPMSEGPGVNSTTAEWKPPTSTSVPPPEAKLVVDVKGRKFPSISKSGKQRRTWKNWCQREDVLSLVRWADRFGGGFRGVLAFVYDLDLSIELPPDTPDLFAFRGHLYLLR